MNGIIEYKNFKEGINMKKRCKNIISILVILISVGLSVASAQTFDWTSFQKDETRNGYSSEQMFLPLTKLLEIDVGYALSGTILVKDSDIFFTTKNGYVGSASLFSGEIIWFKPLEEEIVSSLTISDNNILIASGKGTIFCLDQKTGNLLWKVVLESPVVAPLTVSFRFLYASGVNGKVYCINIIDGKIVWATDLHETIESAACMKLNYVYVTTSVGKIFSLDSQTGRVVWNYNLSSKSHISPVTGTEFVMTGDDEGNLYCFDDITGRLIWKSEIKYPFTTTFAFAYFDKRILCVGAKDKYVGINTGNGVELWTHPVKNASIPPISAGRIIFFPDGDGNLLAVDSFSGQTSFEGNVGANISTSLSISNGRIIFGSEEGKIYVYGSAVYDFNISIKPEISTIAPGESTKYEITVNTTEGFKDLITFSVTGFPCSCKGVARYFDKSVVTPPDNKINLVIDTSPEADQIKVKFTVTAFSGRDLRREATGVLVIQSKEVNTTVSISYPIPVRAGEDFKTSIFIKDARNLRSANFIISYPQQLLYLRDVTLGNFFTSIPENINIDKSIDNEKGRVSVGVTKKELGESGSGDVVHLVFRARKPGNAKIDFFKISLRDSFLSEMNYDFKGADFAISTGKQVRLQLTIGKSEIKIDDRIEKLEAPPFIENGRTLVPIRKIAENCEAEVSWDNALRKVTIERFDKTIELFIGNSISKVNGKDKTLPDGVAPKIVNGRTFVPLRFVAEELDAKVEWVSLTQTILILYPGY